MKFYNNILSNLLLHILQKEEIATKIAAQAIDINRVLHLYCISPCLNEDESCKCHSRLLDDSHSIHSGGISVGFGSGGQPPRVEKNLMQTLASQLSSTLVCIDQNL
jgi:hypothetical protein